MKVIRQELSRNLKTLEIHTFADLHIGDRHTDLNLIKERIKRVAEKDNAYCILNGDLLNNATKTSISDTYAEDIPPMEQIMLAVELFEPIKHKILCLNSGNHECRTYNKEGINLTEVVARQLGLYDKYSATASFLFLRFGESSGLKENITGKPRKLAYTIYSMHGSGGGRKEGAKANKLGEMAGIIDSDIYIHSHTHLPMIFKQAYFRVDNRNKKVSSVDKLFVNTGATLDYGGYGEAFAFKPASKETPIILLNGTRKYMTATL